MASKRVTKRKVDKHKPKTRWDTDKKYEAAVVFAHTGNIVKTSELTAIPPSTITSWRDDDPDWYGRVETLRDEKSTEHAARYGEMVDKALDVAINGVDKLDAKSAITAAAIATDKRQILMSRPTRITSADTSLESMAQAFRKLSSTHTIVPNSTIIDGKEPLDEG